MLGSITVLHSGWITGCNSHTMDHETRCIILKCLSRLCDLDDERNHIAKGMPVESLPPSAASAIRSLALKEAKYRKKLRHILRSTCDHQSQLIRETLREQYLVNLVSLLRSTEQERNAIPAMEEGVFVSTRSKECCEAINAHLQRLQHALWDLILP